ncbi:uncharacterized protein LOC110605330 [Manihot esculenta]|uniref:uncharacterized protein LOC110605330 n=1 Tax=Manihot esculenta TaxID=3983 RepID=UPI000B5D2BAB|nr:uncharacterized protein LOC110605330 [Manihot esculenta]
MARIKVSAKKKRSMASARAQHLQQEYQLPLVLALPAQLTRNSNSKGTLRNFDLIWNMSKANSAQSPTKKHEGKWK